MHLLTELSSVFTEADDTIAKIGKKGKKINDECSNIVDDVEGYLYRTSGEASSIISSLRCKGSK